MADLQPDTSMYPKANSQQSNDPMHTMVEALQIRNAMNNISKVKGGMPMTQESLDQLSN